jgi:DNA repair exonuclease SbcCD ATPase subunit
MSVNSTQLEAEADALFEKINGKLPETPETVAEELPADDAGTVEAKVEAEPDPEAGKEASPAAADTDDLEGLSVENAAERIRNAQARMTRATMEAAEFRRTLSDVQRSTKQLEAEVERLQAELKAAPAKSPDSPGSTAGGMATLETLRTDYPEIMGPLISTLTELRSELNGLKGTVTTRDERDTESRRQAAYREHIAAIAAAHPDYQQVANSDEFNGWLDRQPDAYRIYLFGDGIEGSKHRSGGTAAEVNRVLDQYKQSIGTAKRNGDAREAANPALRKTTRTNLGNNGRPTFTREQIAKMTPAEFAKNEKVIDAAMAEGRIT